MQNRSDSYHKHLGIVIAERRKRLNLTQTQLAESCGVDRAFISNLENGRRNPSIESLISIADGLKIRLSTLIFRCEELNKEST